MCSGLNVLALSMVFLFVPETKQKTLEELDYIFAVPTRTFLRHQLTKALPYWFKRYVIFNKEARLEPLYKLGEGHLAADQKRRAW
jgi:hypothetical protein